MHEKGESLMGGDRDCRQGDSIFPIPDDERVLLCPMLFEVLHYRPRTKPFDSRSLIEWRTSVCCGCGNSSCIEEINQNDTFRVSEHSAPNSRPLFGSDYNKASL
ncbi:hypothetical protein AVEN_209974-1 [Araneus ventricosus]|uniref:Uncharacterized protein n=1 Tax=Araneus ventricosus TaxID=182803 RepID=A0A4Y2DDI0_ARAVE|nr:hypothetical protein AVEN_209974-1 [Araneus ventricosus]